MKMRTGWAAMAALLLTLSLAARVHAHEQDTLVLTNAQGTVVAESDDQGTVTYEATYRPYGQQQTGAAQAGPGYTGHVNDPDTGLVYMQARYYDPGVGRFLSVDPAGVSSSNVYLINRYAYSNNNPVNYFDPTGMLGYRDTGGRGGIGGANYMEVCGSPVVACNHYDPWQQVAASDDDDEAQAQGGSDHLSFKKKLSRNLKWLRESISVSLGPRVGLNAKVKVFKIIKIKLGTGYWGMTGHLNMNMHGRVTFDEMGPGAALQVGRFEVGGARGGYVTNVFTGDVKTLDGFTGYKYIGDRKWAETKSDISVQANILIVHGKASVNLTGIAVSLFYWGDGTMDPNQ